MTISRWTQGIAAALFLLGSGCYGGGATQGNEPMTASFGACVHSYSFSVTAPIGSCLESAPVAVFASYDDAGILELRANNGDECTIANSSETECSFVCQDRSFTTAWRLDVNASTNVVQIWRTIGPSDAGGLCTATGTAIAH